MFLFCLDTHNINNVTLGGHPTGNDLMYGGRPPMQQQGMYGMDTAQRVVDHGGYSMNHCMMSQRQQIGTLQSSMPRMMGPTAASVSPNAFVGVNNNPQMISSMNAYPGMNQFPPGMINSSQPQQQRHLQKWIRMSPNPGGMRMGFSNTGTHVRLISPFQSPVNSDNFRKYNWPPHSGGEQNPAMMAVPKQSSFIPYESPNSERPMLSLPPLSSPSYNSSSISIPYDSTYQLLPHRFNDASLPGPSSQWTTSLAATSTTSQVSIT